MKIVFVILAVIAGAILLLNIATGSVTPMQIAGFGIICAAIAAIAP